MSGMAVVEDGARRPPRRRRAVWYVAGAALLAAVMPVAADKEGETFVMGRAARQYLAGEQFYRPDEGRAFTYPPFFVLPYVPMAVLPHQVARGAWYFINFCLLGGVLRIVAELAGPMLRRSAPRAGVPPWVALLVIAVLAGRFLISPIENQSHDLIVLLLVLLAVRAAADARAGAWAGLAAACKATPALLLPVFGWQRRWTAVAAFLAAGLAATLLPDLLRRNPDDALWGLSWYDRFVSKVGVGAPAEALGAWSSGNPLNQSLAGSLYRCADLAGLSGPGLKLGITACQFAVVALLAWMTWPRRRDEDRAEEAFRRLGAGGAALCAMLLLSPMSSKQHFCALLVPVVYCVVGWLARGRDRRVGAALVLLFLCGPATAKDLVGRSVGDALLACGSVTWCTVICFAASGDLLLMRPASRAAATSSESETRSARQDGRRPAAAA